MCECCGVWWEHGKDGEEKDESSLFLGALHTGCRDSAHSHEKGLMKFEEQCLGKSEVY